ncbi:glycosyltransferase family 2 protein [Sphingomonas bacterium]|uniref:glycosyltransferase family 2 protein n=1 Tax=Sphingomonas bacterium TaxID=1895847 RepID=UPI001576F0C9|nr:glycosyltransferase family 2 protein [Sphingomonas bacterium]
MRDCADVLIVIPCLNEQAYLPALLAEMTRDAPGALLVVADGGSTDASRAIVGEAAAADPAIRLLDNPARWQSAGINAAVRHHGAGRPWLVRIDAHCGYPRGHVAALVRRAEQLGVEAIATPMRARGTTCFQRAVAATQNALLGTGGSLHRHLGKGRFVDHGHHTLIALPVFARLGGYCETMSHNEDAEFDQRLSIIGGRIWLEPACAIDYYPRRDIVALFRQSRCHGAGRAVTVRRHRLRPKLRQLLPLGAVGAVLLLPAAPLAPALALPAIVWLGTSIGFGAWLGWRQRSACVAMAGVAAATMHLGWGIGFFGEWLLGWGRAVTSPARVSIASRSARQ